MHCDPPLQGVKGEKGVVGGPGDQGDTGSTVHIISMLCGVDNTLHVWVVQGTL